MAVGLVALMCGAGCSAAKRVTAHADLVSRSDIVERVASALVQAALYERAGEIYEKAHVGLCRTPLALFGMISGSPLGRCTRELWKCTSKGTRMPRRWSSAATPFPTRCVEASKSEGWV
jgi:hypothetical protein